MVFYFQQMHFFETFPSFSPFVFRQPMDHPDTHQVLTINALCTCLAQQTRAASKYALTVAVSLFSACELLSFNSCA